MQPPIRAPRNPTDFKTIFSSVTRTATASQIISPRDTIPVPEFFQLVFGPINAANNADGVSAREHHALHVHNR